MTGFPLTRRFAQHTIAALALLCLLPLHAAFAWSATGHMIAATIAYRSLSPELRTSYITLLAAHPEYGDWMRSYEGNVDEGAYLFMRASVWPDELKKNRGNPETHAEWHYLNMPLIAPSFPPRDAPKPGPKGDIIVAIELNRRVLASGSASPTQRAVALAWLLHLVGDLHQPLHTTALINDVYKAPKGDKGGNDFFIRPSERAKKPISLHSFWDGLLGTSKNLRSAYNEALELEREHTRSTLPELQAAASVRDWMLESRAIAIDSVYLDGRLAGVDDKSLDAPIVPETYRRSSKSVAGRRVALAGYRLADLLRRGPVAGAD